MKEIHVLNQKEIDTINPRHFNIKGIKEKNIISEYWKLVAIYRYYLEIYLKDILKLKEYDDLISTSKLVFDILPKEKQDIYQKWSNMELNYIYLRNNIYIENLNNEEIETLKNNCITFEFIENTYQKVIRPNVEENCASINYGPDSKKFQASPNSIVLGIRYLDGSNGNSDMERTLNRIEKDIFIENLAVQLENKDSNMLIKVIQYNRN